MKKLFVTVFFILAFLYIGGFLANNVFAQSSTSAAVKIEASTESARVEYNLAYPGILPDNPLYFLKAARDRIVSILINDSVRRAEFNLLTSDKRVYAAQMLAGKGKDELAVSTLSKSNNYFDGALAALFETKKQGRNIDTVLHNLQLSVKKHREVVSEMKKKIGKKFLSQLQQEDARLVEFEKTVSKIKLK